MAAAALPKGGANTQAKQDAGHGKQGACAHWVGFGVVVALCGALECADGATRLLWTGMPGKTAQAPSSIATGDACRPASCGDAEARKVGVVVALLSPLLPQPLPYAVPAALAGALAVLRQLGSVGSVRPSGREAERSELAPPSASAWDSSSRDPCSVGIVNGQRWLACNHTA